MKNLLIYINPDKKFTTEYEILTKIQVDNSLALGWKPEDIMLVTDFEYEYKRIRAIVVDNYPLFDQRITKIPAILELFEKGFIKDDTYWFHDHDAFQLVPFNLKLEKDAGFTDHGAYSKTWNAGSFFFKKTANDIFQWINEYMNKKHCTEQDALTYMWQGNINNINDRYQLLNTTYNIGIYKIDDNIKSAEKPIKIAHFHPHKPRHFDLFRSYIPNRLLKIFYQYEIK
jgi:hypothetical protein